VIANILHTRRKTVVIVTPYDENAIWMAENELEAGKEIEEKIVEDLSRRHLHFIEENSGEVSDESNPSSQHIGDNSLTQATLQYHHQVPGSGSPNQTIQTTAEGQVIGNGVVGGQMVGQPKSLYFQMKFNPDGTTVTQAIPNPSAHLRRSFSSKDDHGLSDEMQEFIRYFKTKRMSLGYTQEDVGKELSEMNGPTYSQSFISRFEGKQLGMKAAERMRPILELFLQQKELEGSKNVKCGKKRRRRTCFSQEAQEILNNHFNKNPKPSLADIQLIANEIGIEVNTVKVWFCNRKQNMKRQGQPVPDNSLRSELDARRKQDEANDSAENHFHGAITVPGNQVKHMLSPSPPSGSVNNLPFILSQDGGMAIVSSPSSLHSTHILPQFIPSSSSQQLVLSQVPFVQTVSAVNQGMSGVVSTVQPVQVIAARHIPTQVLYQSNAVSAVPLNEDGQRIVPEEISSPRKSEADSLLTSQYSNTETRSNELTVVSPSMISRTAPSDIGASMAQRNIGEELNATTQGHRITADTVEVITIDETIDEARSIQEIKVTSAEEHAAKKLKYLQE